MIDTLLGIRWKTSRARTLALSSMLNQLVQSDMNSTTKTIKDSTEDSIEETAEETAQEIVKETTIDTTTIDTTTDATTDTIKDEPTDTALVAPNRAARQAERAKTPNTRLTLKQRHQILTLHHQARWNNCQIERELKISRSTIRWVIKHPEVPAKPKGRLPAKKSSEDSHTKAP